MNRAGTGSVPHGLSFPEVRVVEASAGSGKTYALAKRYVQLILHLTRERNVPPIHTILAITFTNKAAFEMKERILRFLKELALGVMPPEEEQRMLEGIAMAPAEARELAARVIDAILHNYNYFQVETIDKFINSLLVSSAFQLGLTANFRIRTNAREYLALALDELMDDAASDKTLRQAFDDFLTSMLLVEARSAWIPREVILDTLQQLWGEHNTYARNFISPGKVPADMLHVKRRVVEAVQAFAADMPEGVHKTFAKSVTKFALAHQKGFRFSDGLSSYFEPGKGIPATKTLLLEARHEELWAVIEKGFVAAAELEVRHLYDPYVRLWECARQYLERMCVREDIMFLGELNAKARQVYAEGVAPEELYYRLSTRFEHYLFDEFQDTSRLQWENLCVLPEDGIAKGGTLFYVGDKKQAIYSFRGGDTRLFDDVRAQYAAPGYHPSCEILNTSRRSHRSIVHFNNSVFALDNLERLMHAVGKDERCLLPVRAQDRDELRRVYAGAAQEVVITEPEGCVRVEWLEGSGKDEVFDDARTRLLLRLADLRQRFAWRDIGILVRKNDHVEEVTRWLLEAEPPIPSSSERTLDIKGHLLLREVTSFLHFIAAPVDDAAFGEFILGRIFAAVSGLTGEIIQDFILVWRQERKGYLYTAFRSRFPEVWDGLIDDFFSHAGLYPLYETVVSFYRRMGILGNFRGDQAFFMHFLELVKKKETEFPDLVPFLEHYDQLEGTELFVDVPGSDAVSVMTVHKAKGLEFRAVILPFLTMALTKGSSAAQKALNYVLKPEADGLALYHFNKHHTPYSVLAEELDVEARMGLFFSELNNVYVALTRAACELHVFIPARAGNGVNLARYLVPEALYAVGEPALVYPQKHKDSGDRPRELLPSVCRDWIAFLNDEFMDDQALSARPERLLGEAYHAVLARIGVVLPDGSDAAIDAALTPPVDAAMREHLRGFLRTEAVRPFFETVGADVLTEQECVDRRGHTRRVDRIIVTSREVTVVDFKLTRAAEGSGGDQVRAYMDICGEIYPGRTVKGYLIFIREAAVVEV